MMGNGDSTWWSSQWNSLRPMDKGDKTQIVAQLQGSECDVVCFIKRGVHQGTQLQKCQKNLGHFGCNIWSNIIVKEEQTQSPHS